MATQSKALRIGVITAAVIGTLGIPATALAANANGIMSHLGDGTSIAQEAREGHEGNFAQPLQDRGRGGVKGARAQEQLTKLAASLNVSVDTLKTAIETTRTELKDQKPTGPNDRKAFEEKYLTTLAGKLNVSVDALKTAMQQSRPQHREGTKREEKREQRQEQRTERLQALATALGVTPDALKAAIQKAHEQTKPATKPADDAARKAQHEAYLAALATNLNLSVDKVKAAFEQTKPAQHTQRTQPTTAEQRTMLQTRLAQIVQSGKMTQAQADQILADFDAGKPVFETLKQFMPQLGAGDRDDRGERGERGPAQGKGHGHHGPRESRGDGD